jgi:hypothetical protein
MERFWLKQYPPGVPADVDVDQYESLVQLIDEGLKKYANRNAYAFMDRFSRSGKSTVTPPRSGHGCSGAACRAARAWRS